MAKAPQSTLGERASRWWNDTPARWPDSGKMADFARSEILKAAEIADRYREPLIAEEIRKLAK